MTLIDLQGINHFKFDRYRGVLGGTQHFEPRWAKILEGKREEKMRRALKHQPLLKEDEVVGEYTSRG